MFATEIRSWLCLAMLSLKVTWAMDFAYFKTEPSFKASNLVVYVNEPKAQLEDGYVFVSPFDGAKWEGYGPQIFHTDGTLVWYGNATAHHRSMNFHACNYLGESRNHLCFHDSVPEYSAYARGQVRFLNNHYEPVGQDVIGGGGLQDPDLHELHTADEGETVLHTVYNIRGHDLSPYNGPEEGYVLDGCFQERRLIDGSVVFQWCALDHVQVWETKVFIHQSSNYTTPIAGDGTFEEPWDFFHINSVDKDSNGDYLVSARHLNALLKIAGNRGHRAANVGRILWQLGGTSNDFSMDFNFSRQHMARWVDDSPDSVIISLFDNAYDGHLSSANSSRGQLIGISEDDFKAWLINEYPSPEGWLSHSQGGMQIMPETGNIFMTWGYYPSLSEFDLNGTLLYHASFGVWGMDIESYRAYKQPWKGDPKQPPKALSYSFDCSTGPDSPLFVYASWNGATEVERWRVFTSQRAWHGPWSLAGEFDKAGFETSMEIVGGFRSWVYVEALGIDGEVLGVSDASRTFVPGESMRSKCNERECDIVNFSYDMAWSKSGMCRLEHGQVPIVALIAWVFALAIASWGTCVALRQRVRSRRPWFIDGVIDQRKPS